MIGPDPEVKMNKVYLYGTSDSDEYHRLEAYLRTVPFNGRLCVMPTGSGLTSSLSLQLRSNDVMILFAANEMDLDQLIQSRSDYLPFRILLVLEKEEQLFSHNIWLLAPRLIFFAEDGYGALAACLENMCKHFSP
jgi:hypothetical protein